MNAACCRSEQTSAAASAAQVEMRVSLPFTAEELAQRVDAAIASAAERVVAERLSQERVITLQEAVAMTPWTESGFKRVATKENLPFIKGPHKAERAYKRGAVVAMLDRLQVWPKGRPVAAEVHSSPRLARGLEPAETAQFTVLSQRPPHPAAA